MFNFWFLNPDLDIWSVTAILAASIFAILIILPLREISHIWLSHVFSGYKFDIRNYSFLEFFDPLGSLCMLLFGYGWPKRFSYFVDRPSNRLEYVLIYLIGSIFTFLSAILFKIILNILVIANIAKFFWISWIIKFINHLIFIIIRLTVVNLMPVPGLDGFKICEAFIPKKHLEFYLRNQLIISLILSFMLIIGFLDFPIAIMEAILFGIVNFISNIPFVFFS